MLRSLLRYGCLWLCLLWYGGQTGYAQAPGDVKTLFSGNTVPLRLQLKDLNGEWRRVSLGPSPDALASALMMGAAMGGTRNIPPYYTKGETVTLGGTAYVIAYTLPGKPVDFAALGRGNPNQPPPERLTPETALTLSLINLRTLNSLADVQPFDLQEEMKEQERIFTLFDVARQKALETSSLSNLKQLGTAILMYSQDYDEVLPPMKAAKDAKDALMPYTRNESLFQQPDTKEPYHFNASLSWYPLSRIAAPAEMAICYEGKPGPDGTRAVCYVDGHAKRIPEDEFQALLKKSQIPPEEQIHPGKASPPPQKAPPKKPPKKKRKGH